MFNRGTIGGRYFESFNVLKIIDLTHLKGTSNLFLLTAIQCTLLHNTDEQSPPDTLL